MNSIDHIKIETPILLIGFNRPEVIKESFEFIRFAKPTKLYVAIDAPRSNKKDEDILVNEVKDIVQQVDWNCNVSFRFNEINRGAEITVSSAISWVLDQEETVIVLEDDIIAPKSFLVFAQKMLEKYKDDENIYMVSSNQFTNSKHMMKDDYCFAMHGHTWGWATWRRAWKHFDLQTEVTQQYVEILEDPNNKYTKQEQFFFKRRFEKMKGNGVGNSTWDLCWNYVRFVNHGLSIIPKVNLSTNIGLFGLHNHGFNKVHFLDFDIDFYSTRDPESIDRNIEYDEHHFNTYLSSKKGFFNRVFNNLEKKMKINKVKFMKRKNEFKKKKTILELRSKL